jgi:hypothetical protein
MKKHLSTTLSEFLNETIGLDDNTPVLLVNPVGRGSNQFVGGNIEIGDVIVSEDGIS